MSMAIQVLYVDDETDLLDIGRIMLEEPGDFIVTTALSATEAVRLLEREKFDAIISDYQMPGMDGIQLLVAVRARFGSIPFILFTGKGREEVVIQAINNGADFYLQKGGEPAAQYAELTHKVRQAVSHKRAEEAFRKSEEKYRHVIEQSNEAVIIAQDGMLKLVNHRAVEFTGYPEQELLSMQFPSLIHPDDRAMVVERYQMRIKGEEPPSRYTFRLSPADGSIRVVEISVSPINWEGRPATLNFLTDITGRTRTEEALREEKEKYQHLIENSHDIIYTLDLEGRFLFVSPSWTTLLGYPVDQTIGKPFPHFLHPDDISRCLGFLQHVINTGLVQTSIEYRVKHIDGSWRWHNTNAVAIRDKAGRITGGEGIASDITERKRAEDALAENELRFRDLFESSHDAIITLEPPSWKFTSSNRAARALFGVKSDAEFVSLGPWDLAPERQQDGSQSSIKAKEMIEIAVRNGSSFFEWTHQRLDGAEFATTVLLTRMEHGGKVFLQATVRDITDNKRAENALRESEAKFREIFNSANDAIHLHEVDERGLPGKFIDVNKIACQMLQYSREELLEKSPLDLTTSYHSRPVNEIGEEIQSKGFTIFETEHRRKDGSIVPVEVSAHYVVIQGKGVVLSIIRDLTRRKRDEAAFRKLSAEHKAIFDNSPAMIWYKDTKNNFIRVNPAAAEAFGMKIEEIEGKNTRDLFPDFAEKYYADDLEVIHSGKPKLGIIEPMTTTSGEHLWVQTYKIPLKDEKGTIIGILTFSVDITERKHAEEALGIANKKLNLLSSITRHDILNQLTVLIGQLELLHRKQPDPSFGNYFDKIIGAAERIQAMIQFTKAYESVGVQIPAWQNVRKIVDLAAKDISPGNTRLVNDIPPNMSIFADPLIVKVFYNLMDNAIRYGGKITTLRFFVEEQSDNQVIICEDDGAGIMADEKETIFKRGFGKNTGMGLFLAREILFITRITLTETGEPGKGARFELVVPMGTWRFTSESQC